MCNVHIYSTSLHFTTGVAESAVKHSAGYKRNQQINGKEGKGKKREMNRSTRQAGTSALILLPICFTKIWKHTLRSRGKKRLEKLPCQISAINFDGNSAAINVF